MLHTMYLTVVVSYHMYLDVEEGDLNQTWKDDNIVDFWTFRVLLYNHLINYNPTHCKYAVYVTLRPATRYYQDARDNRKENPRG